MYITGESNAYKGHRARKGDLERDNHGWSWLHRVMVMASSIDGHGFIVLLLLLIVR